MNTADPGSTGKNERRHWNPDTLSEPVEAGLIEGLLVAGFVWLFFATTFAAGTVFAFEVVRMLHPSVVIDLTEPQPFSGEPD